MKNSPRKILLVEDEVIIALHERALLEKNGFDVILAHTPAQAIDIVAKNPAIDLILMDIDLGGEIDGTEVARKILRDRELPISFLSSHTEPEIVKRTEDITSYGYIVKNSGETVLIASIKMAFKLFDAHKQERQSIERLQATERMLKESVSYLKAILTSSPQGYWVMNADGSFLDVNNVYADNIGYSRDELLHMNIHDIVAHKSRADIDEEITQIISEGYRVFNTQHRRKDGTLFSIEISTSFMNGDNGKFVCFCRETSTLKRVKEHVQSLHA
jgi:PAS domain S-box-containing protein